METILAWTLDQKEGAAKGSDEVNSKRFDQFHQNMVTSSLSFTQMNMVEDPLLCWLS